MESNLALRFERKLKGIIRRLIFPRNERLPQNTAKPYQEWSIGIYAGSSPFDLLPLDAAMNPVLTHEHVSDVPAAFVADPFILRTADLWYMLFEVLNKQTCKGEIGLATSGDGVHWSYKQIVLREPFHLSYPYVFKWDNEYYMVPESHQARSVRLYKAVDFPTQWSMVKTLLNGDSFVDASLFHFNDKWWLMADHGRYPFYAGILRLFYTDDLMGPWVEHPKSPIIESNPHIARPAGRISVVNDRPVRYTQDCSPSYGIQVRGFEITEITTADYQEQEVVANPVLRASGAGWNEHGMHHIDVHQTHDGQWIACVDGCVWRQPERSEYDTAKHN